MNKRLLKIIVLLIAAVIISGIGVLLWKWAWQEIQDWRTEKKAQVTPQEREALSPKIAVSFSPFMDELSFPTRHQYPFKEYWLWIGNHNKQSVPLLNLTIEYFFRHAITQATGKSIVSGGSGVVSFRSIETQDGKALYEELPAETLVDIPMSLKIEKKRTNGEVINTNIAVFHCPETSHETIFDCSFVVDLTRKPTLVRMPDMMGKYAGKYFYQIKGKQFSGKITGVIPDANVGLIKAKHHFVRANDFAGSEKYKEAVSEYNKAIDLYSEYTDAYFRRGYAFLRAKEYEKAISDCNKVLELNPKYADAYFNRGSAQAEHKKYNEAIQDYTTYIGMKPKDEEGYFSRGLAFGWNGQNDKAISDFTTAIGLNPEYGEAYLNRGVIFARRVAGDYDKAISDYDRALQLIPHKHQEIHAKLSIAYNNRGTKFAEKNQHTEAIADFDRAIKFDPERGKSFFNRALSWKDLGHRERAAKDFKKACGLGIKKACHKYDELIRN